MRLDGAFFLLVNDIYDIKSIRWAATRKQPPNQFSDSGFN